MSFAGEKRLIVVCLSQTLVAEDWRDAISLWDPSVQVLLLDPRATAPLSLDGMVMAAVSGDNTAALETSGVLAALVRDGGWLIRMADDDSAVPVVPPVQQIPILIPVTSEMMSQALMQIAEAERGSTMDGAN